MNFVYIHGAKATSESFTYIRDRIGGKSILIDYNTNISFDDNLKGMIETLKHVKNIFFIAHSLGGIYAFHLANHLSENVVGGITLSTPYGGSREAAYLRYIWPFSQLLKDISPRSPVMRAIRFFPLPPNWTNVVTVSGGTPLRFEANDGVVTYSSMRYRADMELVDVKLNHYEVVVSNKSLEIIKDRVKKAKRHQKSTPVKECFLRIINS